MPVDDMRNDATWPDNRNLKPEYEKTYVSRLKHPGPDQTHVHNLNLWDIGYRPLYLLIGEKPLVVIFSMGFRQIVETSEWCRKQIGVEVLWVSRVVQGMRWERTQNILGADFPTIDKFFKLRQRRDNVVMCYVHMAAPHSAPWQIKNKLPGTKAISVIYDCMDLWVPPDKLHMWDQYSKSKGSNRGEYTALQDLIRGDYIEGLIYKDYGPDWPKFRSCKCPTAWMPSTLPAMFFQDPPRPSVPDRFCFIGTIMPKSTHDRPAGLFSDIMMENVFRQGAQQGYEIHAFCMNPHEEVIQEYKKLFPPGHRVQLFKGDFLGQLLFRLQGRYKWGWMLYEYPQRVLMELPRNSLPTKLFTYMALGIPVVVSEEMEAVARVVRQENIGVVLSQEDQKNMRPILDRQDYPQLCKNVVEARQRYCLEQHMQTFSDMIERVMQAPAKPAPKNPLFLKHEAEYVERQKQVQAAQQKTQKDTTPKESSWRYSRGAFPAQEEHDSPPEDKPKYSCG